MNYIAGDSHVLNLNKTEYVHTIFCKYILGLSETCSNIAARLELGSSTMEIDIQMHIVKAAPWDDINFRF